MRELITTVYQFDELSDEAKERAREWWREATAGDNDFAESVIDDAATIADLLGIDLRTRRVNLMGGGTRMEPAIWWSLGGGDSGASFDGTYQYRAGSVRDIMQHAPEDAELHRIAHELQSAQRPYFYKLSADIRSNNRSYPHVDVFVTDDRTGYDAEDAAAERIVDAMRDFAHWIYRALVREYEYQFSDECVDDNLRANEYEFTEDGERAR
jgi:hypothetical protein